MHVGRVETQAGLGGPVFCQPLPATSSPSACLSLSKPALGRTCRQGLSRSPSLMLTQHGSSVGPPHPISFQCFLLLKRLLFFPGAETSRTFYAYLFEETYNSLTLWFYLLTLSCLFFFYHYLMGNWLAFFSSVRSWHSCWAKLDFSVLITAFFIRVEFDLFVFYFQLCMSDGTLTRSWLSNSDIVISPVRKLSDLPELHR